MYNHRYPEAQENRSTVEPKERSTTSMKTTNARKIRPSDYETATAYRKARETEVAKSRKDEGEMERATLEDTEPEALGEAETPQANTKKRARKQRLVSYSSQESASTQDETTSRHRTCGIWGS